jgi:eukaryotic-like serine/threonine-protein kinase
MNSKKTLLLSFILITTSLLLAGCVGKPVQSNPTPTLTVPSPINTPTVTVTPQPTETPTPTAISTLLPTMTGIDGMTLLYVPAGEFTMGSDTGSDNEKPVHTVYLDAYWIDQTEVTNAMYTLCVQSGKCVDHSEALQKAFWNFSIARYANPRYAHYAAVYMSWNDATTYCEWAGRRLPTEAEWEKAASWDDKTKTKHVYPWGDTIDNSFANYNDSDSSRNYEMPVKSYESGKSPYGAYDMAGGVWEWTNDWYSSTYYQSSPASNPQGPASGNKRSLRGGSWSDFVVRSAYRDGVVPLSYASGFGFRCALGTPP